MFPPLKIVNLINTNIKMSASEMQKFMNIFVILVGDFVPQSDLISIICYKFY